MNISKDTVCEGHGHELSQGAKVRGASILWVGNFCGDGVALPKLSLQVLWAAETAELPIHHDGQACTKSLTLFHADTAGYRNRKLSLFYIV